MIENPRVRLALAEHGRRIAIALAVVGAVMLVLAIWTVATPGSETVRQQADGQTIDTEVTDSAVVSAANAPWEQGRTLENHPAYLLNASPVLDIAVVTDAPPGSTVVHDARLQLRVVRDGEIVWEETQSLVAEETTVTNGTATSAAEIDVEQVRSQRRDLQEEFAGVGTVESRIVADARYQTDSYDGTLSTSAPLSVTGRAYWIDGNPTASDSPTRTVTVERSVPVDWGTVAILVLLGLASVGGAAAAVTYRVEADIDWLQQEVHRQRYDDWISDGNLPMGVGSEYVSLDSLKDVVDVAIDTNQRVVYDDRRNVFAVISGEVVYYYSKDGDWNRVAWPQSQAEDSGPSFLEAFGMGDDEEMPEVEATPSGQGGFGAEPDAGDEPGVETGGADADAPEAAGDSDASGDASDDAADGDSASDGGPDAVFGNDDATTDPTDDAEEPTDGSVGPAERPPEDRPFGDDEDE